MFDYDVIEARHVHDHVVWLRFRDGLAGEVDLAPELHGPVFEPLRDVDFFRRFRLDVDSLAWPNGADLAPEFLHDLVSRSAPGIGRPDAPARTRS